MVGGDNILHVAKVGVPMLARDSVLLVAKVGFSAHFGWGDSVLHGAKVGEFSAHVSWGDSVLRVAKVGFSANVGWGIVSYIWQRYGFQHRNKRGVGGGGGVTEALLSRVGSIQHM
jgi:hypothetical protein